MSSSKVDALITNQIFRWGQAVIGDKALFSSKIHSMVEDRWETLVEELPVVEAEEAELSRRSWGVKQKQASFQGRTWKKNKLWSRLRRSLMKLWGWVSRIWLAHRNLQRSEDMSLASRSGEPSWGASAGACPARAWAEVVVRRQKPQAIWSLLLNEKQFREPSEREALKK